MTSKNINKWIMYHEIRNLSRKGFSNARIGRHLLLDQRTVKKILSFTEQEYEQYLLRLGRRSKKLDSYEDFVRQKLEQFNDTSSAQVHDWLKEEYPDFIEVSERTVFNFVMYVRQKYNIPIEKTLRQYFPVEELPYGKQAQVDFGVYNMRMTDGKRKKVYFFAMVLSRSRMKYVWFKDEPFTAESVCQAHEKAFSFFDGIPGEIVYDQDRTMLVDENLGDLILTSTFRQYTQSRSFSLHFCRKADPESKGKVENVIQYVKKNFLFNRLYDDLEILNTQALAWLSRTANFLKHNYTKKSPEAEFTFEQPFLSTYTPMATPEDKPREYHVRKTNTINYKSNFYSLPYGTYQESGVKVNVTENEGTLEISTTEGQLLCSHEICLQKGKTIINNNHKRDTSKSLQKLKEEVIFHFNDKPSASDYIEQIRTKLPRYIRDHLMVMKKALADPMHSKVADNALRFCHENELFSGYEFSQALQPLIEEQTNVKQKDISLLNEDSLSKANEVPEMSNIEDYEEIINA